MLRTRSVFHSILRPMIYKGHKLGSDSAEVVIESYLDYTCPFSRKGYERLVNDVVPHYEKMPGKVQFIFRHQVQPWHPQSTLLHEAALAVEKVDPSKFFEFSGKLFQEQDSFNDQNTANKSRLQIYAELADIAESTGVDKDKFAECLNLVHGGTGVTNDLKYYLKISRQNSIHVSPTVLINGLIDNEVSSSWTLEQWQEKIEKV